MLDWLCYTGHLYGQVAVIFLAGIRTGRRGSSGGGMDYRVHNKIKSL